MLSFSLSADALVQRTVVVSGATGGLGTALSKACASAGATVVLIGRSLEKLEALYDVIESIEAAPQAAIITIDQAQAPEADYAQLQQTLTAEFGKLDALVHCAADATAPVPMGDIKQVDWSRIMAVNLHSARLLSNACLPLLSKSDNASITFTTDDKTGAYWGAYGVSKAALNQMAHILFDETENQRNDDGSPCVAINSIDPGAMRTQLRRKTFPGELESESPSPDDRLGPILSLICRNDKTLNGALLKQT